MADLDQLPDNPFVRLRALLADVKPQMPVIDLGIGEPRHPVPRFVIEELNRNPELYGRYPPTDGTPEFRSACANWLARRFNLPNDFIDAERHIVPVNGTREALFLAAFLAKAKRNPAVLIPNPFYQAYAAAAIGIGAEPIYVPATAANNHLPDFAGLSHDLLQRTVIVYVCSPANPQGTVADLAYWQKLIALARAHDFLIFADECYTDIYDRVAPTGILEAAAETGTFENILSFHSLSKRSSLPGLRSGFVVGDAKLMVDFKKLRLYGGSPSPLPVLHAAAAAWNEDAHAEANRALYRAKLDAAERIFSNRLGFYRPPGGFFLWLDVSETGLNAEAATVRLYERGGVRVVPGSYFSRRVPSSAGAPMDPGENYIRLALVHDLSTTQEALTRVNQFL
ncbi:MAG: aminotransferase class I/II-fold pyridoxal phosphate-dependent enzyme [Alphaproteobacteria bacterium]